MLVRQKIVRQKIEVNKILLIIIYLKLNKAVAFLNFYSNIDLSTVLKVANYWRGQNYSITEILDGLGGLTFTSIPVSGLAYDGNFEPILRPFFSLQQSIPQTNARPPPRINKYNYYFD
jgi:hypothetical protein